MEEINLNVISGPLTKVTQGKYNYSLGNHLPFNDTNLQLPLKTERVHDILYLSLFSATTVVALFGNSMVCKVVFSKANMRNFTNLLLVNLALSDILCVLTFPVGLFVCWDYFILKADHYACVAMKIVQMLSLQVSSVTMIVIAIDRFLLVYYPLVRKHRQIPLYSVILFVWISSFVTIIITSPSYAFHRFFIPSEAYIKCEVREVFSKLSLSPRDYRTRLIIADVGYFWVPLTVIAVCYGSIAWKVMSRNVGTMTPPQQEILLRAKWKTMKMLIASVAVFFLCWFPFIVLNLLDIWGHTSPTREEMCNKSGLLNKSIWLIYSSCCYNPFVYWIYSEDFRGGLKDVCGWHRTTLEPSLSVGSPVKSSSRNITRSIMQHAGV